jgi:hypothetical protein
MASVHYLDLPLEFERIQIPKELKTVFGSRKLTKFLLFVNHFLVDNSDYDQLMLLPPHQQNGETREDYYRRKAFQQTMRRYKPYFYDYRVYEKKRPVAA